MVFYLSIPALVIMLNNSFSFSTIKRDINIIQLTNKWFFLRVQTILDAKIIFINQYFEKLEKMVHIFKNYP